MGWDGDGNCTAPYRGAWWCWRDARWRRTDMATADGGGGGLRQGRPRSYAEERVVWWSEGKGRAPCCRGELGAAGGAPWQAGGRRWDEDDGSGTAPYRRTKASGGILPFRPAIWFWRSGGIWFWNFLPLLVFRPDRLLEKPLGPSPSPRVFMCQAEAASTSKANRARNTDERAAVTQDVIHYTTDALLASRPRVSVSHAGDQPKMQCTPHE